MSVAGLDLLDELAEMERRQRARLATVAAERCPTCVHGSAAERACPDRGAVVDGFDCRWTDEVRDERTRGRGVAALRRAGVPARLLREVGAPLTATHAMRAARRYVELRPPARPALTCWCGETGRGKSLAAAWALGELGGGRWLPSAALARPAEVDALCAAPALVLDDVGAGNDGTDWWRGQVIELLSRRYDDERPTIVTSNLEREALLERLGGDERTASRIGAAWVTCTGPDMREEGAT